MTKRMLIGATALAALLVALPSIAGDGADEGPRACSPEGTWYGANSSGLNFIFRVVGLGGGEYSIVADGFSIPEAIHFCLDYTAWHGDMARTGPRSYAFRQLEFCDPDPATLPEPGIGLWFWAVEGEFTMTSCDHMAAFMPVVGAYVWNPLDPNFVPPVPFVDPFAITFSDPGDPGTYPPIVGDFFRMIAP